MERPIRSRRPVVKIGTSALLEGPGRLRRDLAARLLGELCDLHEAGVRPVLVTSGAIGLGFRALGCETRPTALPELQAAAAIGQARLIEEYNALLAPRGFAAAQILLTHEDVADRKRYLNIQQTFAVLQKTRALPVVNENDTVAVDEIKFGDNDVLSALVADLVGADALILLTNVPGLLRDGAVVPQIERIDDVERLAEGSSDLGTGGMASKLQAARIAAAAGIPTVIAEATQPLRTILSGPLGTFIHPAAEPQARRKRWIASTLRPAGRIQVDAGAGRALRDEGRSLLAVGIIACEGDFDRGDAVEICLPDGTPFARGLVAYAARDLRLILGRRGVDEVVHKDNLVVIG